MNPITLTRRQLLAAVPMLAAPRPKGLLVDTHIHLFDPQRFPYAAKGTYQPAPATLDTYNKFIVQSKIDHTIIIHPEPYQDDHTYLEYCFKNEPRPGFFKGTCLFDPIDPKTPGRIAELMKRTPKRIVALRIHVNRAFTAKPTAMGAPIRDRDMRDPQMIKTWEAVRKMGLAVQMHFIPCWGPEIGELAARFSDVPVILDHLARAGQGTPQEYDSVLKLAKLPKVYMKFSGVRYSSKQDPPHRDAMPLVRRTYDAFGPGRMLWGGLGHNMADFEKAVDLFEAQFAFASEADRAKIRGLNAKTLFQL
jgi:predicted TIM-barrel fold metal-dependent hydrolase